MIGGKHWETTHDSPQSPGSTKELDAAPRLTRHTLRHVDWKSSPEGRAAPHAGRESRNNWAKTTGTHSSIGKINFIHGDAEIEMTFHNSQ